jgi:hypothetical protein
VQRLTGATTVQFKLHEAANQPSTIIIKSQRRTDEQPLSLAPLPFPHGTNGLAHHKNQECYNNFRPTLIRQAPGKATVEMIMEAPHLINADNGNAHEDPRQGSRQGNSFGTLWVQKAADQPFSVADGDTLQALTTYAAVALTNAQLVQHLQNWNTELEQKVEERTHRLEEANLNGSWCWTK